MPTSDNVLLPRFCSSLCVSMDTYIGNDFPGPGEGMTGLQASSFPSKCGYSLATASATEESNARREGLELEAGVGRVLLVQSWQADQSPCSVQFVASAL